MSSVGLVLGGGGVTGAAFEIATLMAIEIATGWRANDSEAIVGTSSGSFVTALVRHDRLDLDSLVRHGDDREAVAERISRHLFNRRPGVSVGTWLRHGILPGIRQPGLTMLLGSPAPWEATGLRNWVREQIGEHADGWPHRPTVITAYDVHAKRRVAFGTTEAPVVGIADAVAASSSIPLVFRPHMVAGRPYVDGGVVSGTHGDLILGNPTPLDLVLVVAPMAAFEERRGAWFHERMFDRVGTTALDEETALIRRTWPECEILVLRPPASVLASMRPNPMDPHEAVPTFIRTLVAMKRILAEPATWGVLSRHLTAVKGARRR
jgi:NTE family protein